MKKLQKRIVVIIIFAFVLGFFGCMFFGSGGMALFCQELSTQKCNFLVWAMVASILGGILLSEILISRNKKKMRQQGYVGKKEDEMSQRVPHKYYWMASAGRIILTTILLAFPVIIASTFSISVLGAIFGVFLDGFIRALIGGWIPILAEDENHRETASVHRQRR